MKTIMKTLTFLFLLLLGSTAFAAQRGPIWIDPIVIETSNHEYTLSKSLFGRKWDIQRAHEYLYVFGQGLTVQDSVYFPKVWGYPEIIINVGKGDYPDSGWRFTNSHRAMVLNAMRGPGRVYSATTNNFIDFRTSPNPFYALGVLVQDKPTVKYIDKFRFILKVRNEASEPRVLRWRFYYYKDGLDRPMTASFISIFLDGDADVLFIPSLELLSHSAGIDVTYAIFSNPLDPDITVP